MGRIRNNRIVCAAAGVCILLVAGLVYSWSVFSTPIAAEFSAWTKAQLSLTFTLVMIFFCLGCTAGGFLANRIKPSLFVLAAAGLFALGFFLAAGTKTPGGLYVGFGVLCGFAAGIVYNAVLSTVGRWFPDKPGLISGILLMGFGFSSFLIGIAFSRFTPDTLGAWRGSFRFMGTAAAAILVLCSFFLCRPGEDFVPPALAGAKKRFAEPGAAELSTTAVLKTGSFWLFFLWATLLSAAGVGLVSQASPILRTSAAALQSGTVAFLVGLMSVFNGAARVVLGAFFDRCGRAKGMLAVGGLFLLSPVMLYLALRTQSAALATLGLVIGGMGYGGVTTTNSYFIRAQYGAKHYPLNFSVIVANLLIASFGSTAAGALFDRSGSYVPTFRMIAIFAVISVVLTLGVGACLRKRDE